MVENPLERSHTRDLRDRAEASQYYALYERRALRYREALPAGCPPADAVALSEQIVLRLIPFDPACAEDFASNAAKGKGCPKRADPCRWAACSIHREDTPRERIKDLAKLPNLAHMRFIAQVLIDERSGTAKPWPNDEHHISLWMYAAFEPHRSVQKLEPLP